MKRRKIPISEIVICCLPFLFFSGCFFISLVEASDGDYKVSTKHSSVVFDLNNLWDMEFPEGFSSAYIFYNRGGWFGEGEFFAVYNCEQYNEEFLADFSQDYNEEVKERINCYFERFKYDDERYEIILDRGYQPDFENDFVSISYHTLGLPDPIYTGGENSEEYGCDDHLYMSFFHDTKTLYIYELIT